MFLTGYAVLTHPTDRRSDWLKNLMIASSLNGRRPRIYT